MYRFEAAFSLVAVLLALLIWRSLRKMHDAPDVTFDLRDLIMENGRVSKAACVMMGAFASTTWFFIYYTLAGKMTEGYFALYGGFWITPVVARIIKQNGDASTPSKVTATTTTETTLETKK